MSTKMILRLIFFTVCFFFLFFLGSCGSATTPTPFNPENTVDVYGIQVDTTAPHSMNVNQPYHVSALISSPDSATPIIDLYGAFPSETQKQQGPLYQLLQPSSQKKSTVKTFELCVYINLDVDQSAFTVKPAAQTQWAVLAPDGNHAQNSPIWQTRVSWNVLPQNPDGVITQDYSFRVDIGFDAKVSCDASSPSLLSASYSFNPTQGDHSIAKTATTTVVDQQLSRQVALLDTPRKILGVLLAAVPVTGFLSWLFPWIFKRLRGEESTKDNQNDPPPNPPSDKQKNPPAYPLPYDPNTPLPGIRQVLECRKISGIAGFVIGIPTLLVGLLLIYLDTYPTIVSFVIETSIAFVSIAFLAIGLWLLKPGKEVRDQKKPAPNSML